MNRLTGTRADRAGRAASFRENERTQENKMQMMQRFTFSLVENGNNRRRYRMLVESGPDFFRTWKPENDLAQHYLRHHARSFGHWDDETTFLEFFEKTGPGTYEWVVSDD